MTYSRQKYTTVMARVSKTFVNILWKEYQELNNVLRLIHKIDEL